MDEKDCPDLLDPGGGGGPGVYYALIELHHDSVDMEMMKNRPIINV